MDDYQKLNTINQINQLQIDEFKSISKSLDVSEDALRNKILLRCIELNALNKEFNTIITAYTHIISLLANNN
jgi:hypothetical protein